MAYDVMDTTPPPSLPDLVPIVRPSDVGMERISSAPYCFFILFDDRASHITFGFLCYTPLYLPHLPSQPSLYLTKKQTTEESQIGGKVNATDSASGAANLGASPPSKKSGERKKSKKFGQKAQPKGTPQKGDADAEVETIAETEAQIRTPKPKDGTRFSRSRSRV
jgi:hypothetical protein